MEMKTIKDEVISLLDKQNEKGMEKYGQSLDDCPVNAYDWNNMLHEELIDGLQYAFKENQRLQEALKGAVRTGEVLDIPLPTTSQLTGEVLADVDDERSRQVEKWGIQRHSQGDWLKILVEEVGEVAQAMQADMVSAKQSDASHLYKELIQTAAVAVAMAEQVREESDR